MRDDNEFILVDSPIGLFDAAFEGVTEHIVILGHTHMPFDRLAARRRFVNAGSVGLGYGHAGASWALLDGDVTLRRTVYDPELAARTLTDAAQDMPFIDDIAANVRNADSDAVALAAFTGTVQQQTGDLTPERPHRQAPGSSGEGGARQTHPVRIDVFDEAAIPDSLRAQTEQLRERAWPSCAGAVSDTASRHDAALSPQTMLLLDDQRVVAALDILTKDSTHVGNSFRASGISAMVTDPDQRGLGHGHHLVNAAHELIASSGVDIGIFTCDRPLQRFYERAGWPLLPGSILIGGTVESPFPSDQPGFDKVTLADFFSPHASRHRSAFEHARIGLYPGEIDRLW
jgi:aminoglycoside 2'-N-acetyltransferase I